MSNALYDPKDDHELVDIGLHSQDASLNLEEGKYEEEDSDEKDTRPFKQRCSENVTELKKSPYDLFIMLFIVFVDSLSYFAFSYALIMHLGKEVGLPDESAGLFYGIFGISISVSSIILGFVVDKIQVKLSICLSAALSLVTRMGMAYAVLAKSPVVTAVILFVGVGPAMAFMGPAILIGLKRYSNSKTTDFVYAIYYGVMNMAASLSAPAVDLIRIYVKSDTLLLPPYALLIAVTALLQILIFFAAMLGIRDVKLGEDGIVVRYIPSQETAQMGLVQKIKGIFKNRKFWIASYIAFALIGVRSAFRYLDALYLPYVTRAFRDADSFPYLTLVSLNPIIVITLTTTGLITVLTRPFHPLTAIIVGSLVGGVAPIFMALGPYIWAVVICIVFISLGEVIWSPISYSHLMDMTEEGEEGAWMALGGLPMFLAKVLTGGLTGALLANYCPDPAVVFGTNGTLTNTTEIISHISHPQLWGDPDSCYSLAIWGIITATTVTSFFFLIIPKRWITIPLSELKRKKKKRGDVVTNPTVEMEDVPTASLIEGGSLSRVPYSEDEDNKYDDDDF